MPLHIDVRVNDELIERLHIARLTKNGMSEDSVNEYGVIRSEKEITYDESGNTVKRFAREPEWVGWLDAPSFQHRYGEDALTCLLRALETLMPERSHVKELEAENARLRAIVESLGHSEDITAP